MYEFFFKKMDLCSQLTVKNIHFLASEKCMIMREIPFYLYYTYMVKFDGNTILPTTDFVATFCSTMLPRPKRKQSNQIQKFCIWGLY